MDGLRGIIHVAEYVLYETLGLLMPGAAFTLALAAAVGGGWWDVLIEFADEHPWLAVGGAYVLGYPVQGISRPIITTFEWLFRLPGRVVTGIVLWLLPDQASGRVQGWLDAIERRLTRRHTHTAADTDGEIVDLRQLEVMYWRQRLGLTEGQQLTRRQAQNLSFSVLLSERSQLDRFRAAASLARGTTVAVAAAFVVLSAGLLVGAHESSNLVTCTLVGLPIMFYGLVQRADMYDGLWREIIPVQLLCTVTRDGPLVPPK